MRIIIGTDRFECRADENIYSLDYLLSKPKNAGTIEERRGPKLLLAGVDDSSEDGDVVMNGTSPGGGAGWEGFSDSE